MSIRPLGVSSMISGRCIEAGGEPLDHRWELENDEVTDRRLTERATLVPELAIELVERSGRDPDRPALNHPRQSGKPYRARP